MLSVDIIKCAPNNVTFMNFVAFNVHTALSMC